MKQYLLHKKTKSIYKARKFLIEEVTNEDSYVVSCIVAKTMDSLMIEFYTKTEMINDYIPINIICRMKKKL